jgi:hypothetical protein
MFKLKMSFQTLLANKLNYNGIFFNYLVKESISQNSSWSKFTRLFLQVSTFFFKNLKQPSFQKL